MWGIVIALVSGALMSLQGIFNTEVTKQTSIWVSAGWVQLTALITCILFCPVFCLCCFCIGRTELLGLFGVEKAAFEWKKLIGALIAIAGIIVFRWEK